MCVFRPNRGIASINIIATDFNPLKTPGGKDKEP
jgi:hypothetical protein